MPPLVAVSKAGEKWVHLLGFAVFGCPVGLLWPWAWPSPERGAAGLPQKPAGLGAPPSTPLDL